MTYENKLQIKEVSNGFLLEWSEPDEIYDELDIREVIEKSNDEKETMTRLLEFVAEHFGIIFDKFSPNNLVIKWDKVGHKALDN